MTFLEYNIRRSTIDLLKEYKMSLKDEKILYENSLNILNESLWDTTKNIAGKVGIAVGKAASVAKKIIDIPEKITNGMYKAYKVMKSVAFLAALVYLGFRFDAIRALFPWLAPVIDKMGDMVLNAGKDFLYGSFMWLKKIAADVVEWLVEVAKQKLLDIPFQHAAPPVGGSSFELPTTSW